MTISSLICRPPLSNGYPSALLHSHTNGNSLIPVRRRYLQRLRACSYLDGVQSNGPLNSEEVINVLKHGAIDTSPLEQRLVLLDLDPGTAKLAISFLGPFLSAFAFLFILRIVMSWYPKLPVGKFPYVIAYAPTEPFLGATRKLIPPLAGVDVTPVVWFGLVSFLNEILLGPQGLLVLLSQKQV
ncbi:protein COFACTOR ASSEMBLY OF COMPLEX C SUBUNIT B CCB3, chloroplastic isoform X1 [Solanum lycopersicum]|uniref:Protein COFACTOR ASSEMBLY OF COMPLEX C SUBUNIT B CCB3, chloroplastic n=1 Tax=Solanum lycopersicum TaxID=4081 RepID=A0A3Q7EVL2_SOLLC|nr:protein COFACTOR ASSEMBLY OF COMPLEX C SUBUNIT B CCB3, chloroplastic isoform X1 [Solanum lycopersicum]